MGFQKLHREVALYFTLSFARLVWLIYFLRMQLLKRAQAQCLDIFARLVWFKLFCARSY